MRTPPMIPSLPDSLALAGHLHEHAARHNAIVAAALLAETIRAHHPRAATATLAFRLGSPSAHLQTPTLPRGQHEHASLLAAHLDGESWATFEMLAVEERSYNSASPAIRRLELDLNAALVYRDQLADPTGANCPRSCPLWRCAQDGGPDTGPCHACGARPGAPCHRHCPDTADEPHPYDVLDTALGQRLLASTRGEQGEPLDDESGEAHASCGGAHRTATGYADCLGNPL